MYVNGLVFSVQASAREKSLGQKTEVASADEANSLVVVSLVSYLLVLL